MSRGALLVTADESTGPLAAVRALRAAGFAPHVVVSRPDTYAARSRAAASVLRLPDPGDHPDAFADAMAAAAARLGVRAVLPATETSLIALTGRESRFGDVPVGTGPADALARATDKERLAGLAARHGLQTPETRVMTPGDDLREVPLPAVLKPVQTVAAGDDDDGTLATRRVRLATETDGLAPAMADLGAGRVLVQPLLEGQLTAVSGLAWHGRVLSSLHQRSLRVWPPVTGASAYAMTVAPDAELDRRVAGLLAEVGWSGIYNLQFLAAADRRWLIDFNPRAYGSLALAVAAGHDLPTAWAELVLGGAPALPDYRTEVALRVEERLYRGRPRDWLRDPARGLAPAGRPREVHNAIVTRADPLPLLAAVPKVLGKVRRGLARA